jgi:hypothetical protein
MSRARRRARLGAGVCAVALAGVLASACGVPSSPSAISLPINDRVSAGSTTTTSSPTTTTTPKVVHQTTVYFFGHDGLLTPVSRPFPDRITPGWALYLLAQGPYKAQKNLSTQVPQSATKPNVRISKGIADVPLDGNDYAGLYAAQLSDALAQIVVTLMLNFSDIKGVNFYLHSPGLSPVRFNYTPSGTASSKPVTVQTYANLLPRPKSKTSKASTTTAKTTTRSASLKK